MKRTLLQGSGIVGINVNLSLQDVTTLAIVNKELQNPVTHDEASKKLSAFIDKIIMNVLDLHESEENLFNPEVRGETDYQDEHSRRFSK